MIRDWVFFRNDKEIAKMRRLFLNNKPQYYIINIQDKSTTQESPNSWKIIKHKLYTLALHTLNDFFYILIEIIFHYEHSTDQKIKIINDDCSFKFWQAKCWPSSSVLFLVSLAINKYCLMINSPIVCTTTDIIYIINYTVLIQYKMLNLSKVSLLDISNTSHSFLYLVKYLK